jgi:hypothetical protein
VTRAELIELAAPACTVCEQPVQRCEMRWEHTPEGWVIGPVFLVCAAGHRSPVRLLD